MADAAGRPCLGDGDRTHLRRALLRPPRELTRAVAIAVGEDMQPIHVLHTDLP